MALQTGDLILGFYPDDISYPAELLGINSAFDKTFRRTSGRLVQARTVDDSGDVTFEINTSENGHGTLFDQTHADALSIGYSSPGNTLAYIYDTGVDYDCEYANLKKSGGYWLKISNKYAANASSDGEYLATICPQKYWFDYVHGTNPNYTVRIHDSKVDSDAGEDDVIVLYHWTLADTFFDKYVYVPSGYEFVILCDSETPYHPSDRILTDVSGNFDYDYTPAYQPSQAGGN